MVLLNNVSMVYDNTGTRAANGLDLEIGRRRVRLSCRPLGQRQDDDHQAPHGRGQGHRGRDIRQQLQPQNDQAPSAPHAPAHASASPSRTSASSTTRPSTKTWPLAMRVVGAGSREIAKRVPYVLQLVGLEGRESRLPQELGGEQQRVAIVGALVNSPSSSRTSRPATLTLSRASSSCCSLKKSTNWEPRSSS